MDILLRRSEEGFEIISGHMRLEVALSMMEEVPAQCIGLGQVLVYKNAEGQMFVKPESLTQQCASYTIH